MNNKDLNKLGHDILDTVQEAVETCDFSKISKDITDTVNMVVGEVSSSIKQAAENQKEKKQTYKTYELQRKPLKQTGLVVKPSKAGWNVLKGIGICGGVVFGLATAMAVLEFLPVLIAGGSVAALTAILSPAICTSLFSAAARIGDAGVKQIKRFNTYVDTIGYREYIQIEDLSMCVRKDSRYVARDLQKMIQKGWFLQGHLDKQKTCLMVTNDMYKQYKETEYQYETRRVQENQWKQVNGTVTKGKKDSKKGFDEEVHPVPSENQSGKEQGTATKLPEEVQKIIDQGDEFVRKIRKCNDDIPGEEISAKIDRMEKIVDKIFDRVEQNPDCVKDIRKLMDYYLPTTVKLLEAYADMDAQPIGGENIKTAKAEIEASLDTLNAAYEKLLDDLFQATAWDVSSDISVLKSMLAQEGLQEEMHIKNVANKQ